MQVYMKKFYTGIEVTPYKVFFKITPKISYRIMASEEYKV